MTRTLVLVICALVPAAAAGAEVAPELAKARAAYDKKKFADALKLIASVEARPGNSRETTLAALELKGLALAATQKTAEARAAFERVATLAPDRPAPSAAAKVLSAWNEAKKAASPISFAAAEPEVVPGTVKRIGATVDGDRLQLGRKVRFASRAAGAKSWETVVVDLASGRAGTRVDAGKVEWFATLLGERDAELLQLGSESAPLAAAAPAPEAPPAVAPAAAATPPAPVAAPPAPAEAVVFRVTPIQVVVQDTKSLGGAEQAALVSEEIARALPPSAFKVTTAAQLQTVLGIERQRQLLACGEDSSSCTAELANALGAEVVVSSTLAKSPDGLRCSVVFLSGRDGNTLERVVVDAPGDSALFERLDAEVSDAAARLFAALRPGARLEPRKPGVRKYAVVPAVAALVLGGTAGVMFALSNDAARSLQSRNGQFSDAREVSARASMGRTTETLAWVFAGASVAALAAAGLVFTLGAPTEPKVSLAPLAFAGGGGLTLSGRLP